MTGRRRRAVLPAMAVAASVALAALPACGGDDGGTIGVSAMFDATVGVYESGPVLVLDSEVGSVEEIELDGELVRVELRLRDDVPLPRDVHAAIEAQTVLGERSVTLFPAWSEALEASGAERLADGDVIPVERTEVPTEPDEALQSFNELLSSLDPEAVGGLVTDGARILDGRGEQLGQSLDAMADLSTTVADIDVPMLETARSLREVAGVLNERDTQLRSLIHGFGTAVGILADERRQVEALLSGLVGLTDQVQGIVDVHGRKLPGTIATLAATLEVIDTNADTIPVLAAELPQVAESFEAAYKPDLGGFFLKVNTLAVVETVVEQLLDAVGLYPGEV